MFRYAPDTLGPAPSWTTFAACAEPDADPDVFFDEQRLADAVSICQACPVRQLCLADALAREGRLVAASRYGVFGGLGPEERYRLGTGRRAKTGRKPAECGSEAAYRRHRYKDEPICDPCRDAHRRDALARYHRRKAKTTADAAEGAAV